MRLFENGIDFLNFLSQDSHDGDVYQEVFREPKQYAPWDRQWFRWVYIYIYRIIGAFASAQDDILGVSGQDATV